MKKRILTGLLLSTGIMFSQTTWNSVSSTMSLNPITASVGIGTVTPVQQLHVAGTIQSNSLVIWGNNQTRTETRNDAGLQGNAGARSGCFEAQLPSPTSNWPNANLINNWWHLLDVRHSNSANNYAMQFAGSFFDQDLYFRKTNGSPTTAWSKVLTSNSGWSTSGNTGTFDFNNYIGTNDNQGLTIKTNGIERMKIAANGNIGMAQSNPQANLHLVSPVIDLTTNMIIENLATANGAVAQVTKVKNINTKGLQIINNSSTSTEVFKVYGDGRTMIGSTNNTPAALLHVFTPNSSTSGFFLEHNAATYGPATAALIRVNSTDASISTFRIERNDGSATYHGFSIKANGQTRIGLTAPTNYPNAALSVDGTIVAKEVIVTDQNWADFVFSSDYKLAELKDVEAYYKLNKHLPEIPNAKDVEENGFSVGEINKFLLQKIEELTIYVVEQQKQIDALKEKIIK
jgi:hypothetical protein